MFTTVSGQKPATNFKPQSNQAVNPFARALAETEKHSPDSPLKDGNINPFSEALAKTGGGFADSSFNQFDPKYLEKQQKEAEEKARLEALRKKRHDEINPVDRTQLFDARRKQELKEIEKIRQELKLLAKDIVKFNKEVDITLMGEVPDAGMEGKYHKNFFQQLRALIMLLRQRVKSARTWATQLRQKAAKKKKRKGAAGIMIDGAAHEQTKSVYDMMHHERSNAYSGS